MQTTNLTISQRNEILQDIIDRLLYLQGEDKTKFEYYLSVLLQTYTIDMKVVDGVRVYGTTHHVKK